MDNVKQDCERIAAGHDKIQLTESNQLEVRDFAGATGVAKLNNRGIILYLEDKKIMMSPGDYLFKDKDGKLVIGNPA